MRGFPHIEQLFLGGYFNGHIETTLRVYDGIHGSFGFGERTEGGILLKDFTKAFYLVIANSSF